MITADCSILKEHLPLIDTRLEQLLPVNGPGSSTDVIKAARYALLGPGKKLRPSLTLASYLLYHDDPTPILDAACSIEMIHTYSLIHDDLPGMDDDDMRRGRPTVHIAFSEATAILAGDLLLTHAFGTLADMHLPSDIKLRMISEMSRFTGGFNGMIAGQAMDLQSEGKALTESALEQLHSLKTGALIELSVLFGVLGARPPENEKALLMKFAKLYGLAFQVADDIADILHPEEKHGKTISSDLANNKMTYVSLLGLDGASKKAHMLISEAEECLRQLGGSALRLGAFLELLKS